MASGYHGSMESWEESGRHILSELERLNKNIEALGLAVQIIHIDLATLKLKAGLWGAAAGILPVIGLLMVDKMRGR